MLLTVSVDLNFVRSFFWQDSKQRSFYSVPVIHPFESLYDDRFYPEKWRLASQMNKKNDVMNPLPTIILSIRYIHSSPSIKCDNAQPKANKFGTDQFSKHYHIVSNDSLCVSSHVQMSSVSVWFWLQYTSCKVASEDDADLDYKS